MSAGTLLRSDVDYLLQDHGQSVTFRRVTEGSYDPSTGTTGAASTDDESATVAFLNYNENLVDGTVIQRGDRKAIVSAEGLSKTPNTGDQFVGEAETVSVVVARKVQSGGVDIAYICQVRE